MKNNSLKGTRNVLDLNCCSSDSDNRAICINNAFFFIDEKDWETAISWADNAINNYSEDGEENTTSDIARSYAIKGYCLLAENRQEESKECYIKSTELHIKAYNSKKKHKGLEFYKFFSLKKENIDSILGCILLKHPSEFNDPMDSPILQDENNGVPFIEIFNGIRVGCFGEVKKNNEYYLDQKKWSFYGDMHKGICICYNFSEIEIEDEYSLFQNVDYDEKYAPTKGAVGGFLSKSKIYEDEDEWRFIIYDKNRINTESKITIPIKRSMIRKVYFGFKCDKTFRDEIYNKLKGENIDFFKVYPSKENFYELICSPFSID